MEVGGGGMGVKGGEGPGWYQLIGSPVLADGPAYHCQLCTATRPNHTQFWSLLTKPATARTKSLNLTVKLERFRDCLHSNFQRPTGRTALPHPLSMHQML